MKRIAIVFSVLILIVLGFLFLKPPAAGPVSDDHRLAVYASVYPAAFLAQRIGGDQATVDTILPPGAEPHDYAISPQQLVNVGSADLLIYNGAGLDTWVKPLVDEAKKAVVVDLADAAQKKGASLRQSRHRADEENTGNTDPHIWLDIDILKAQAQTLREVFTAIDRDHALQYQQRFDQLVADLDALDAEYQQGLASCRLRKIVVAHDAFAYAAARYRIEAISISGVSPEDQPSAKELASIANIVRKEGIGYVFFETLANPKLAQTLAAETGAQTAVLNPIEGLTATDLAQGKDYFSLMRENLRQLQRAMDCQ